MPRKLTQKEVIDKFISIHGNKFDYSKVEYKLNNKKVKIICPKHGEFLQYPADHSRGKGCLKCGFKICGRKPKTTKNFIHESKLIHGNKYEYSKVDYVNWKTKVIIQCKLHGEFTQRPQNHLNKHGCPECANLKRTYNKIKYYSLINPKKGKKFGHLYQLLIFNNYEMFFKVGITSYDIEERYKNLNDYDYIILEDYLMTNLESSITENQLLKTNQHLRHKPLIKFGGHTECFKRKIRIKSHG